MWGSPFFFANAAGCPVRVSNRVLGRVQPNSLEVIVRRGLRLFEVYHPFGKRRRASALRALLAPAVCPALEDVVDPITDKERDGKTQDRKKGFVS